MPWLPPLQINVERVNQAVHGGRGVVLGHLGQVGITRGGGGRDVTQERLEVAQAQTLFEQVGGEAVA